MARPTLPARELLLDCFQAALAAVDARACVARHLHRRALRGDWQVIAIGKAAAAMALGAVDVLGPRLCDGLVVTKPGHVPDQLASDGRLRIIESSHPQPDERSLAAGAAVVDFVCRQPRTARLLFLVSGGASSLVESLAPGVTLDDLQRLNAWAFASGRPIDEVNALRRRLSAIKGGGLATLAAPRTCRALYVSDVPRDDPAVIGSGLLGATVPGRIVAGIADARRAAAARARALGLQAVVSPRRFLGEAAPLGERLARRLLTGPARTMRVWGGESTMTLPPAPGYGGRNQHLALSAALVLQGRDDVALLAGGTDGIDGVTEDAGAVVDGGTLERGRDAGLEPHRCLDAADSGRFLEAAGDLLHTGPTLTNVGDLVLGVRGIRSK